MTTDKPTPPKWIVARLGDDLNWWIEEASADVYRDEGTRGLLDPRQVSYLAQALEDYRPYGFRRQFFNGAFQLFHVEFELDDDRLRLAPIDQDIDDAGDAVFALPLIESDEAGAYCDFLEAISTTRIRKLNATHAYVQDCTELEMQEELDALDRDRYFTSESIHCFDEINAILQWSPAEWDDSSSG